MQAIVESGNDYLITVKGNQPRLYQHLCCNSEYRCPRDSYTHTERTRDRVTYRTISVFDDLKGITPEWLGLRCFVRVERKGWRKDVPYHETHYYISSVSLSAVDFANLIRGHWGIENRLHWVKDVVFCEDKLPIAHHQAAINWSIIRTIVINLARRNGYESLTTAQRMLEHDLERIFFLLE